LAAVGLSLWLVFSAVAGAFLAEAALHPRRRSLGEQARQRFDPTEVAIKAADGATLRAWSIRPRAGSRGVVILLHGVGDNRLGVAGYAELFLSRGFGVLMPDARAHGESGGELATYGVLEANDIRRWFEWVKRNERPDCIFGFGESMGAAQLLQALAAEPDFCAVAVESPFSSLREIAYDRVGQVFQTGPWLGRTVFRPAVEAAFLYARWRYGFDLARASPESAVATTRVPVLLIHGQNDRNIPVRHSRRIAARNPNVVLWEVPNAGHSGALGAAPREFAERVIGWFRRGAGGAGPERAEWPRCGRGCGRRGGARGG
jgi:hypothetical protein